MCMMQKLCSTPQVHSTYDKSRRNTRGKVHVSDNFDYCSLKTAMDSKSPIKEAVEKENNLYKHSWFDLGKNTLSRALHPGLCPHHWQPPSGPSSQARDHTAQMGLE